MQGCSDASRPVFFSEWPSEGVQDSWLRPRIIIIIIIICHETTQQGNGWSVALHTRVHIPCEPAVHDNHGVEPQCCRSTAMLHEILSYAAGGLLLVLVRHAVDPAQLNR
jgi:hypothetical protein